MFRTSAGRNANAFAHSRMTDLAAYPSSGTGTINLRLTTQDGNTKYPGASGEAFTLDLVRPTIATASIPQTIAIMNGLRKGMRLPLLSLLLKT